MERRWRDGNVRTRHGIAAAALPEVAGQTTTIQQDCPLWPEAGHPCHTAPRYRREHRRAYEAHGRHDRQDRNYG